VAARNPPTWVFASFAGNSRFTTAIDRATMDESPAHSHSIVSGTYKLLKNDDFLSGRTQLTVRFAVKKCRLVPIDGDRWRTIPVDHIAGFTTIK
jgi:hypothetical protein